MDSALSYRKRAHVGNVTLHKSEIDLAAAQEIGDIAGEINADPEVYVVLLTGTGDRFCTGTSPADLPYGPDAEAWLKNSPSAAIASLKAPVLAVLNGDALGVGLEIALACDLRLAGENAGFALPQIWGDRIPLDGGTQRLARLVGKGKALEMVLTGERISAAAALEIGLVNRVVAREKLEEEAEKLAQTLAGKAPLALRYCKEAVNKGLDLTLEQGLRLEADLYFLLHTTSDRSEGIRSFLAKRPPEYQGK
jgi:enoyl-CoA hydratase/carnithine racemase